MTLGSATSVAARFAEHGYPSGLGVSAALGHPLTDVLPASHEDRHPDGRRP